MVSNVADAPGLADRPERRACRRRSISHRGQPDRETFDRAVSAELEQHGVELVALAGFLRIFSPWFPAALGGPPDQHPSLAAALLQGPARPAAGARCRRSAERLHRAFRHPRPRFRADHRPGGRAGAGGRHARRRFRRASCARSTASTRWSCAGSPRAASRLPDGRVDGQGRAARRRPALFARPLVGYRNRATSPGRPHGRRAGRLSAHLQTYQSFNKLVLFIDPFHRPAALLHGAGPGRQRRASSRWCWASAAPWRC